MVKITFQPVAGQKGEKDNDKSEILIPRAAVSAPPPPSACGGARAGAVAIWTQAKRA